MKSKLGDYIHRARCRRRLSPQDIARDLGYSSRRCAKGARRLMQLETCGIEEPNFTRRVIALLALDLDHAHTLAEADEVARRESLHRWADERIEPLLVLNFGPHWFLQKTLRLPEAVRNDQTRAERLVSRLLRQVNRRRGKPIDGYIVWSRRTEIWFDQSGAVIARTHRTDDQLGEQLPCVQINNARVRVRLE